jgi:hypothetical protein
MCGRSDRDHPGNVWFRTLVQRNRDLYKRSPKHTKLLVTKAIVDAVQNQNPPGRFMKFTTAEDYSCAGHIWTPITYAQAVNKVSSSLREKGQRCSQNNTNVEHVQQQQRFGVLKELNFEWKRRLTLEDRLAQLADYRKNNGDCNVPCQFEGYKNLGKWADNQRQQYKLYKENKECSMTKERIRAMENLGFKWRLLPPSSAPALVVVLPAEKTVAYVNNKEQQQIEHEDDDEQMLKEKKISSNSSNNNNYDGDSSVGDANIIEVPPAESIVVDVNNKEHQQIKHENDDDQMLGENKTTTSNNNNYDGDSSVENANICRTEQDDHDDDYYGSSDDDDDDDDDDLVF